MRESFSIIEPLIFLLLLLLLLLSKKTIAAEKQGTGEKNKRED
jgi:hypothetical protein